MQTKLVYKLITSAMSIFSVEFLTSKKITKLRVVLRDFASVNSNFTFAQIILLMAWACFQNSKFISCSNRFAFVHIIWKQNWIYMRIILKSSAFIIGVLWYQAQISGFMIQKCCLKISAFKFGCNMRCKSWLFGERNVFISYNNNIGFWK